jgi:hypothetical protein
MAASSLPATRIFPVALRDLDPIADAVVRQFRSKGYEVVRQESPNSGWHLSITGKDAFKTVLGMKTALNVEVESSILGITAEAGVGMFGQQFIPALVSFFVAWPVLSGQIWERVQACRLDTEVFECIEASIAVQSVSQGTKPGDPASGRLAPLAFCTNCGTRIVEAGLFCAHCGGRIG